IAESAVGVGYREVPGTIIEHTGSSSPRGLPIAALAVPNGTRSAALVRIRAGSSGDSEARVGDRGGIAVAIATRRDITTLPGTIDWLRSEGLLLETDVEVNPDLEICGIQKCLDGSLP